jgi:formate C-acetyltransferase
MRSFDDLMDGFRRQMSFLLDVKLRGNHVIERLYATRMPAPFLSVLVDDCIERGRDYHAGGARYNTSYVQGVGLGTVTDSLAALRRHVYDIGDVGWDALHPALSADFAGADDLRGALRYRSPRYGNDDDEADEVMRQVFESYFSCLDGRPNSRGGSYHVDMLPTTCHIYFGSVTGATPDGRCAGEPLSEGISPVQGADRHGPTAVVRSAAKLDHAKTGGTLLNLKFAPSVLKGADGIRRLTDLIRAYFQLGGHHIQFNVVTAETLRDAKARPDKHRDLIVRVAGYSDYFCDLTPGLQDEIIARTEHEAL